MRTILLIYRSNSNDILNNNNSPLSTANTNSLVSDVSQEKTVNKHVSNNFEFPLDINDTIFVLTINKSRFKENVGNIVSKMVVLKELNYVNLDILSEKLANIGIKELNIFSIDRKLGGKLGNKVNIITSNHGAIVDYMELNPEYFIKFLNYEKNIFQDYNKYSLYIARGGNYIDIKNIFATIDNMQINLGRGGSQKAHILSPIDFRLSCYMMAMFNFDYKLINGLNTFNYLSKDRYLS